MIRRIVLSLALVVLAPPPASAQEEPEVIQARIDDLTSLRQIKHMQARWGHMAMSGDWHGMAQMVTPDAELVTRGGVISRRAGVEQWLRSTQGHGEDGMPAGRMNIRLFVSPVVTLADDGQSATGRWHEVVMTAEVGGEAGWQDLTHIIDYAKTDEGWRIARIRPYEHFSGSYAGGWSHDPATLERAPYHYTPDEAGQILPDRRQAAWEDPRHGYGFGVRVQGLLAQSHAQNTVNAYGYYLDRGLYEDIVDLFADDAVIEMGGAGSWSGHDGVRAFLTRFGEAGLDHGELNDRLQLMPMANVAWDGSMALIRNVEVGMTGQHGGEGQWQVSMQTFLLRPDEENRWRIHLMHRSPIMRADYEDGWANPLPAMLPAGPGGEATGETRLGSVDFREHGYAVPPLGFDVFNSEMGASIAIRIPPYGSLQQAEAFDGAENVSNAYGYYIDQFSWRNTAEVFSRDGWKELSYIGTFIGQDRVLGSLIQRYGEGGPNDAFQAIHQKTQPYVTVSEDGQRAQVRTRLWQFNSSAEPGGSWIGGIYENQVVKEDGIWRIHGMDLDYVWLGDYASGWTGIDPEASSRFGPDEAAIRAFAPDAPLRGETFAPFPRIAPMGFHFLNPVSGRAPDVKLEWSDGNRHSAGE
ncbi:nuclear transport factor 2 family protein [Alteraurantiacibacter aquimixticola]|uniref:SnoaL-like domain-containing protein n=1 Tax=Alteraurantiacibacter aquimixticola TaxID=2489173 RepID=A0A4T3F2J5_9SPHN|nr:nuclear transport factor 2 family protein [Alteraurantiacibacter aquimixticola]TIX51426.1 hypothetical protein E5222_02900 [Alteraurantiacibacter aquimixticola]